MLARADGADASWSHVSAAFFSATAMRLLAPPAVRGLVTSAPRAALLSPVPVCFCISSSTSELSASVDILPKDHAVWQAASKVRQAPGHYEWRPASRMPPHTLELCTCPPLQAWSAWGKRGREAVWS